MAMTFPETQLDEYMQWKEDEGRTILHDALKIVEETAKQVGPIDVSGDLMARRRGSNPCRSVR